MSEINNLKKAQKLGQSIWLDSISRDMIKSGELSEFRNLGVSGVTSNPTIFQKAIDGSSIYDDALIMYAQDCNDVEVIFERIMVDDIRNAADVMEPCYEISLGKDGFVSVEVSPLISGDTARTIKSARRLWAAIDRPNIMIKVPGTPEGMPAIRALIGDGINVNVTLLFSVNSYMDAARSYIDGLNDFVRSGKLSPNRIASVASFFVSRVDTAIDNILPESHPLRGKIGIANAKVAYAEFLKLFDSNLSGGNFYPLSSTGAQLQRPLWASTGVKDPKYPDTMYIDGLMAPHTVNTLPETTLEAFNDHGTVENRMNTDFDESYEQMRELESVMSMEQITDELLLDGLKSFSESYNTLLKQIEKKISRLTPVK